MQKDGIPFVPRCRECRAFLPYEGALHPERQDCSLHAGVVPRDPVEWTVYCDYCQYPTLNGRSPWARWYVFGHLFFTCGGGYEWINGGLVDVCSDEWKMGEPVHFMTPEDEVQKFGKAKAGTPYAQEQARQYEAEWIKDYHKKPARWYPFDMEFSNLGRLPEDIHPSWLLAACDATQMYLQGSAERQSLRQIYRLIELRTQLFARIGLTVPSLDETRMTVDLLRERTS
ncbi:MAG TPA: hypothetical protein VFV38_45810 [Ktedonobacteraceae bacterium]|nr:hypothetical protein [Ktedonobacteraceae bacterium]